MTDQRDHATHQDVKVLFIAGAGRSGSTILHNILGQIDGFTAVGELRDVWDRGVLGNWLCGCQQPFHDCPTWNKILSRAYGGVTESRARAWADATESFRSPHLPLVLIPGLRRRALARSTELRLALAQLYRAINEVTDSRVIVDSSKNPSFGYLLLHVPGLDVRYLHVVRDAPAVAHSWGRRKEFEPGKLMAQKSPMEAALQWDWRNGLTDMFLRPSGRAKRIRYEDFLLDPRASVADIVDWVGEPDVQLPFIDSHRALLDQRCHSVFGNEVRFARGEVELRPDERWRTSMPRRDVMLVRALTWPMGLRYRYPPAGSKSTGGATR